MIGDTVCIPLGYSHNVLWLCQLSTKGGQVTKPKNIVRITKIYKYCISYQ